MELQENEEDQNEKLVGKLIQNNPKRCINSNK